ncbi:MAG: helix-turn-helix transcriptional regulator [Clostridia bacterium]|nr:helix-turn-helix transcriptional regulator [Clostridia bacterium]
MFGSTKFHFRILSVLELSWEKNIAYAAPRPFHALSLRIKGDATFTHGGNTYHTGKNDLIYVPKNYGYTIDAKKDEHVLVIHFDIIDASFDEIETFSPINPNVFVDLFEKIHQVWYKKAIGYEYKMDSIFSKILENIEIQTFKQIHSMKHDFASLLDYIHSNFTDTSLNVELLAKKLNISATYLRKLFKENLETTPLKYLNDLRIEYATALLESGYYTIEEVAEMSGFSDPKYFSTNYKKNTGMSPIKKKNGNYLNDDESND